MKITVSHSLRKNRNSLKTLSCRMWEQFKALAGSGELTGGGAEAVASLTSGGVEPWAACCLCYQQGCGEEWAPGGGWGLCLALTRRLSLAWVQREMLPLLLLSPCSPQWLRDTPGCPWCGHSASPLTALSRSSFPPWSRVQRGQWGPGTPSVTEVPVGETRGEASPGLLWSSGPPSPGCLWPRPCFLCKSRETSPGFFIGITTLFPWQ